MVAACTTPVGPDVTWNGPPPPCTTEQVLVIVFADESANDVVNRLCSDYNFAKIIDPVNGIFGFDINISDSFDVLKDNDLAVTDLSHS